MSIEGSSAVPSDSEPREDTSWVDLAEGNQSQSSSETAGQELKENEVSPEEQERRSEAQHLREETDAAEKMLRTTFDAMAGGTLDGDALVSLAEDYYQKLDGYYALPDLQSLKQEDEKHPRSADVLGESIAHNLLNQGSVDEAEKIVLLLGNRPIIGNLRGRIESAKKPN
jgi:hypothetical protein